MAAPGNVYTMAALVDGLVLCWLPQSSTLCVRGIEQTKYCLNKLDLDTIVLQSTVNVSNPAGEPALLFVTTQLRVDS